MGEIQKLSLSARTGRFSMLNLALAMMMTLYLLALAELYTAEAQQMGKLEITVGKASVVEHDEPIKRIFIADPSIADFVLVTPKEFYVIGKAAGVTNMILQCVKNMRLSYEVEVNYDIIHLKQHLHEILPEENELRVSAINDCITLSGRMSDAANLSQAISLAQAYAPGGKVNNLVEVRGVQQVMLEVRVAEMQRSLMRRLGINFNYLKENGEFGISKLAGLTEIVSPENANIDSSGPFSINISSAVNALFRLHSGSTTWMGIIDALKSDGLVKVLAEPTLIALSGEKAAFSAGGEFPVPVPQGLGTVSIEYKKYGVLLEFTPTVLAKNKINIHVKPVVSEIDFSSALQFGGYVVPGLTTRGAETVVELADGQSFAIAGLLRDTARDTISKFPVLGDLPILGVLFRSREFQKNETELVIIVTPHLVKPLDPDKQPLPTDFYREPNDTEFYLQGLMEGRGETRGGVIRGDLDGQFGYALPRP